MYLTYKNLTKELYKNKLFLLLLFIIIIFTSFLFYFIRFSIDKNVLYLNKLPELSENQLHYLNALKANTLLAKNVLFSMSFVAAFVFIFLYFHFFKTSQKPIGVLLSLGIKKVELQKLFVIFTIIFSVPALFIGMLVGYFVSSVQLKSNELSYNLTSLVKGINLQGILMGLLIPLMIFVLTIILCGFLLYKKENGVFLFEKNQTIKFTRGLSFANWCVKKLPDKKKLPLRIALRKPIIVLFIFMASSVFTVMLVLGWSLTESSKKVYDTQTIGHHYLYDFRFDQFNKEEEMREDRLYYLNLEGIVIFKGEEIQQNIMGLNMNDKIYSLQNLNREKLGNLEGDECYISIGFSEMYSVQPGDRIRIKVSETEFDVIIKDIAYNAKAKSIILSKKALTDSMKLDHKSFNGVLSMDYIYPNADTIITSESRLDALNRDKVSNAVSAVINQVMGILSGVFLLFLALLMAFQERIKDLMILNSLGYDNKSIKKMLINIYLPIVIISYAIMSGPSIFIARAVQQSLAKQMGDYMPFSTNLIVIMIGLGIIIFIYWGVQITFIVGIKQVTKKKSILEFTNSI